MKKEAFASFFFFCVVTSCSHAWSAAPDWTRAEQEAGELLSQYLRIDTTNPPGNEIAAAQFWKDLFVREGIDAQVFESHQGNIVFLLRLSACKSLQLT